MTQVKFNNEKWWVLHQESWIEIAEEFSERVFRMFCNSINKTIRPTPDQIYSLPKGVEFEIKPVTGRQLANTFIQLPYHKKYQVMQECGYLPVLENSEQEKSKEFFAWVMENDKRELLAERLGLKVAHLKDSEPRLKDFCKDGCEATSYCVDTCEKYLKAKIDRSEEVKKEQTKEEAYINKILDVTNTATITQAPAAVAAIKALCKECLGDLAPNELK